MKQTEGSELSQDSPVIVAPDEVEISSAELNEILKIQQVILTQIADNEDYLTIIGQLCGMAESLLPNSVASVMLLDDLGLLNVLCAPSVPSTGVEALRGLRPGPTGGSCGNAVFGNEPVFVSDTFTDPRWEDLRQVAYDFNLRACWSNPVRNEARDAIGSFALSSFEHRAPSAFHKRLLDVAGSVVSIVLAREQQAKKLAENRHRLELMGTALARSKEGVIVTDANNDIVEINQAFRSITGYRLEDVKGKNPRLLASGKQDRAFYQTMWSDLLAYGHWSGEIVNRRKDHTELTQWMSLSVIRDGGGQIQSYVAVFTDLTELKAGRAKLVYALEHDQLTGLPNKSRLNMQLDEADEVSSLLLLNVDNFSYINTAYGMAFGDQMLCAVAHYLKDAVQDGQVFRINADEFAIHFQGEVELEAQIRALQQRLFSHPIEVDGQGFNISLTCGGAVGRAGVFGQAVQALRRAREQGKSLFHIYDARSDEPDQVKRLDYIRWNGRVHQALNENRLVPYFQGIRDNRTGEIAHYEALVRLRHKGEIYSPVQFLHAAKLSGLLPTITRRVIDLGFAALSARPGITLSFNITEEDLNQDYLEEYLESKARQYGINPERVMLEILEGVSASAKQNHIKQLNALKQRGYRLAIDDFGTEYSNFERILELNVDCVKIDAKYIRNIADDRVSYEVARAIVYFAKNAGIATVAEFVHSEAVQAIVMELGIEYSQGYLFSEPAPTL